MSNTLHFSGSDPTDEQRVDLEAAFADWRRAVDGDSNDDELSAMSEVIEALLTYSGITEV